MQHFCVLLIKDLETDASLDRLDADWNKEDFALFLTILPPILCNLLRWILIFEGYL